MVVLFGEKAGLAIDAALDNVQRRFSELDAGAAGHGYGCGKLIEADPFSALDSVYAVRKISF